MDKKTSWTTGVGMRFRFLEIFDYILLGCVLVLVTGGIFFIYSSGVNSSGISVSNEYIKQIIFASTGIFLMILTAFFDYRKMNRWIPYVFAAFIIVLLYTLKWGRFVNGARSWIGLGDLGIQPSEFGKIAYILFLAWYLERSQKTAPFRRFIIALSILALPAGLILVQPDMGTASVYIPIFLAMVFVAGITIRYILYVVGLGVLTIVFTVLPIWQDKIYQKPLALISIFSNGRLRFLIIAVLGVLTIIALLGHFIYKNKYYYWLTYGFSMITASFLLSIVAGKVLQEYQIMRLIVFINPQIDPLGSGWNIIQSKIAIGSGSLFGQGFLQGTQSHYRYLPQQSTDFIFSILAEESGFLGGLIVFGMYFIILMRILFIMKNTKNVFGYFISAGILAMFFFHFVVNVGMVMGIMPITGIPLLFLSYGGSSLWTAMTAMGLLMSIHYRYLDY